MEVIFVLKICVVLCVYLASVCSWFLYNFYYAPACTVVKEMCEKMQTCPGSRLCPCDNYTCSYWALFTKMAVSVLLIFYKIVSQGHRKTKIELIAKNLGRKLKDKKLP